MKTSTIYFEVKTLSWIQWSDIDGDGVYLKTYETVGTSTERVRENDQVKINFSLQILKADGAFQHVYNTTHPITIKMNSLWDNTDLFT